MEAIVLAGGLGTRLRKVISDVPKPMAPIAGHPFLEILLTNLSNKGFQRVILAVGYMAEKIINHFGSHYKNIELLYAIEEKPLGTGGGIRLALEQVEGDHAFVFNGDTFLDVETILVEQQWQAKRRSIIVGCEVPDTFRYGRLLEVDGFARGFTDKGIKGPGLINGGCYLLHQSELDVFPLNTKFSFEADYLIDAVVQKKFDVFIATGNFIDIGIPEDYHRAEKAFKHFIS